jgi:NAD(P)-dependent dehydrogenase (short-subunit alcohol dehydrogenase family)
VTGGDSGIGRAVAVGFAREGARVAIAYLDEHSDAQETLNAMELEGAECFAMAGDIGNENYCKALVGNVVEHFGSIDILINNAADQHATADFTEIGVDQIERTFRTNVFGYFLVTREALKLMKPGAAIVNTTSVTAYKGSAELVDYTATRGAIVACTRSLSKALVDRGIRVNAVAPGPIWSPLILASFDEDRTVRPFRFVRT